MKTFVATILVSSLPMLAAAADTVQPAGIVGAGTTTDCPRTERTVVSIRYSKGFEEVLPATTYGDEVEQEVVMLLEKYGVPDVKVSNHTLSIEKRKQTVFGEQGPYWRASGSLNFKYEGEKTATIIGALGAKGYQVSARMSRSTLSQCKAQ